jgi:hypothetical protein
MSDWLCIGVGGAEVGCVAVGMDVDENPIRLMVVQIIYLSSSRPVACLAPFVTARMISSCP